MVRDRLTDGVRIGQLLASEISGNEGRLRDLRVADADPDVEPTVDGALAYAVVRVGDADGGDEKGDRRDEDDRVDDTENGGFGDEDHRIDGEDGDRVAEVYVQPDRVRVEFRSAPEAVADRADEAGLRVRPKAVRPPRTLVFVEDGVQVKRLLPVLEAMLDADGGSGSEK